MNVNSFQDRENVIPCQALTKQAKNRPSKAIVQELAKHVTTHVTKHFGQEFGQALSWDPLSSQLDQV